jgi:putative ABC transport system substrate-binding protein
MNRRHTSLALLALGVWPFGAQAQPRRIPLIGFLGTTTQATQGAYATAFAQRLRELGWIEGRSIEIEYRWGDGRNERLSEVIAEFVRLKVDVIVTGGNAVLAAKQATSDIPIVFGLALDPVGAGMVASLSRPGGNVTGLSMQSPDLAGKRLGIVREILPRLRRMAILANAGYPAAMLEMAQAEAAARTLGITAVKLEVRQAKELAPAIAGFEGGELLYVCTDALIGTNIDEINKLALAARLPTVHGSLQAIPTGGLMAYAPNVQAMFKRAADLVDKILKGARPADLPVEQPTEFELAINLKTARALGLTIPQSLLMRADRVIE